MRKHLIHASFQNWYYQNEHDQGISYQSLVQNSIEKAFQSYRSRQGSSTINIQPPGRPETYQINFSNGQQTNKNTNKVKDIKRE